MSDTHGKICYLILPTTDPGRASAFYRSVFGWKIRSHSDGTTAFDDATGQVSGMWVEDRPPASEGSLEVHVMVDNLPKAIEAIRSAGGSVDEGDIHTDAETWALFRDPDGNRLGIYEHMGG